jgi:PAS domain S-box-containing protein
MQTRIRCVMASRSSPLLLGFLQSQGLDWDSLSEAVLDGVFAVRADGTIFHANASAVKALGVATGALLADAVPELAGELAQAAASGDVTREAVIRRGDATYLAKVLLVRRGGALLGALCVLVAIADSESFAHQMRAYEELTRAQDTIIDSSQDGLWICDGDATVLRINPASERLNQITASQVVGRSMRDLVDEGFIDRSVTLEVLRTGGPVNMFQARKNRRLMVTAVPVRDEAGRIIRVVVNERDITEIDTLHRQIEEHENMRDRFRDQMLEM